MQKTVGLIFSRSAPGEVIGPVIQLITIEVANLGALERARATEGRSH